MEDKQQLELGGGRQVKSSHLGISILVLSLLLGACVPCLIYVAVRDTSSNYQSLQSEQTDIKHTSSSIQRQNYEVETQQKPAVKDEAHVHIRNEDGSEMNEDVEYNEDTDVATLSGSDGSFVVEDFRKGFQVVKAPRDRYCYVVPVGTNKTAGSQLKNFVKNYGGEEVLSHTEKTYDAMVLPGVIEDTSFIPEEAHKHCDTYHWLSVVGEHAEAGRVKRDENCQTCVYTLLGYTEINGKRYLVWHKACYPREC